MRGFRGGYIEKCAGMLTGYIQNLRGTEPLAVAAPVFQSHVFDLFLNDDFVPNAAVAGSHGASRG